MFFRLLPEIRLEPRSHSGLFRSADLVQSNLRIKQNRVAQVDSLLLKFPYAVLYSSVSCDPFVYLKPFMYINYIFL